LFTCEVSLTVSLTVFLALFKIIKNKVHQDNGEHIENECVQQQFSTLITVEAKDQTKACMTV
jgi:hypothetical protein